MSSPLVVIKGIKMSENKQSNSSDNSHVNTDETPKSDFKNEENTVDTGENKASQGASENNENVGEVDTELNRVKVELEKAKNDFLYLRAEFDNFRRNTIKERSQLVKYGAERLVHDLLNVMDNFDRALEIEVTPESINSFKEGIVMTSHELKETLNKHGVTEVPCVGEKFDPMLHEALSSEPTNDYEPGVISRVFKKAYKMHDKVIRPGQVVVATENTNNENN